MLEKYVESKRKRYVIKRIIKAIPVVIFATVIAFLLLRIGATNPARRILGQYATDEMIHAFRIEHGLNQPIYMQYLNWMKNLLSGHLGTSIRYGQSITSLIKPRLVLTFQLMGLSILISIVLGITMGVIGALKHNTWVDYLSEIQALFWRSAPSFWVAVIFSLVFGLYLKWFPPVGYEGIYYLILPAMVLGLRLQAIIARLTRSSMLHVLNQEYIKTAKSKGLKRYIVILKHALRNALIPVVTVVAMRLPWLFGGAMITERIFNIPGMGRLIYTGAINGDFILVQSSVLIVTILAVIANLAADISYTIVDPRIELEKTEVT